MFRKRSVEKKMKLIAQRQPVKVATVKTVLCLVDPSEVSVDEIKSNIESVFKKEAPQLDFVYYIKRKNKSFTHLTPQFNKYHLHWDGDLIHPHLPAIKSKKVDLLLNYFQKSDLTLQALSLEVDAGFRVGFSTVDQRLNDLILTGTERKVCWPVETILE